MKGNILFFAVKRYPYFKAAVFLCLLCSLVISACVTNTSTPTPTMAMPIPTIVSSGPCELAPGDTFPLSVTGVSGSGVTYSWSASRGAVMPPDGPRVLYKAPDTGGDDIIRVEAQRDGQSSVGVINCVVSSPLVVAPNPIITPTVIIPAPTHYPELKVRYEIVPCWKGQPKIKVTYFATGGNDEYFYDPSGAFDVQIDDTKTLVVTSGDGQIWTGSLYISRNLMRNCISSFEQGNGDGDGDGNGGDDHPDPPPPP